MFSLPNLGIFLFFHGFFSKYATIRNNNDMTDIS